MVKFSNLLKTWGVSIKRQWKYLGMLISVFKPDQCSWGTKQLFTFFIPFCCFYVFYINIFNFCISSHHFIWIFQYSTFRTLLNWFHFTWDGHVLLNRGYFYTASTIHMSINISNIIENNPTCNSYYSFINRASQHFSFRWHNLREIWKVKGRFPSKLTFALTKPLIILEWVGFSLDCMAVNTYRNELNSKIEKNCLLQNVNVITLAIE